MSEDMIERIARTLYVIEYGPDSPVAPMLLFGQKLSYDEMIAGIEAGTLVPVIRDNLLEKARAAIAAMREPTEAMIAAGSHEGMIAVDRIYGRMIDAALNSHAKPA